MDKSDGFYDENGTTKFEVPNYRLDPFSRYAAYVQTVLSTSVNMDGARSQIIYFHTKPSSKQRCNSCCYYKLLK